MTFLVTYQTPAILQKRITANNLQQATYKAAMEGYHIYSIREV